MKHRAPRSDDRGHGELALRLTGLRPEGERADLKVAGLKRYKGPWLAQRRGGAELDR